jgi:hypothetical protein
MMKGGFVLSLVGIGDLTSEYSLAKTDPITLTSKKKATVADQILLILIPFAV